MAKLEELNTQLQEQILNADHLNQCATAKNINVPQQKADENVLTTLKKRLNAKPSDDKVNLIDITIFTIFLFPIFISNEIY